MKGLTVAVSLLLCTTGVQAETVYKCIDAQGRVTFTQQSCPNGKAPGLQVEVQNPRPSGVGESALMAPAAPMQAPPSSAAQPVPPPAPASGGTRVTVVGGSLEAPACSTGLSERDLRTAMVRKEIVPGMSRKEIESMFGTPSKQSSARGGGTSTYWNDRYLNVFSVDFDRNGCVESSYQSGASD